ncbi:MAG TPA: phosphate ABC transporter permease subunit PstC [Candidatus Acidoferrales bacterium]|nr:phosphate ABC transporter permease subunit PstC [Candidatus Acidoferrales bacterium]
MAVELEGVFVPETTTKVEKKSIVHADGVFKFVVGFFAFIVVVLLVWLGVQLYTSSRPAFVSLGFWEFIKGTTWDPVTGVFGALPFIYGTIVTSFLALLIATPLGIGTALFLAELSPKWLRGFLQPLVELLAGIPSVIYGLWGIFILSPLMASKVEPFLSDKLGFLPFFKGYPLGIGFLTAAIILAIMIVPFIISVSTEVLSTVPVALKEGMYALGATRWETTKKIALPYARSGIFGSIILALARALGETMAVTMVIGNTPQISKSLLDPGYTMAAVIANEFTEATSDSYLSALVAVAFILLLITLLVNAVARWLIWRTTGVK